MDLTEGLILSSMMGDGSGSGGGSGNPGYQVVTENVTIIPQQSVTTVMDGVALGEITLTNMEGLTEPPESLQVVFNGTSYNCPRPEDPLSSSYGAQWDDTLDGMDWSEYPFSIALTSSESGEIATESEGTYTVSATISKETLIVTEDFAKARGYSVDNGVVTVTSDFTSAVRYAQEAPTICNVQKGFTGDDYYIMMSGSDDFTMKQATYNDLFPLYVRGRLMVRGYVVLNVYQSGNTYRADLLTYSNGAVLRNFFSDQADTALHWSDK